MTKFPFHLKIRNAFSNGPYESVTCTSVLRTIAGKREVYDAVWNSQAVIVKVFLNYIRGLYALKKEWRGLTRLQRLGLNAPKTLFWGRTEDGRLASVTEKITNASTALGIFNGTEDKSEKVFLLKMVCRELAKQHIKGVKQKDLHLGNFMVAGGKVFAIDPVEIRFHTEPLSKEKSITQLAILACYLPAEDTVSIKEFCREYFAARGWELENTGLELLLKKAYLYRKRGIKKWLRKSLRTGTRYVKVKTGNCGAIFDRTFCEQATGEEFIKQIDSLMDKGEILKRGNTCYVSAVTWKNQKVVIKRYNYKGILRSLYYTIHGSRARHGWLSGHRLILLNIATPKPVAFIERRIHAILWDSYLVTKYIEGQKLHDFMESSKVSNEEKSAVAQKVVGLLDNLNKNSISHGDLKHSNILVTDNGLVLTDLDAMQVHRLKWLGQYKAARDMGKFINGAKRNYNITSFMKK